MSESITSTGPGGPMPNRSSHAAGSSQTSSLVDDVEAVELHERHPIRSLPELRRARLKPDTAR